MLKSASDDLDKIVDELRDAIVSHTISDQNKDIFKTREVYDIIRHHYFSLKKDYEKALDTKFAIQQKIISPPRAIAMAKNIFVNGDFKTLRADLQKYHKDEQRFSKNLINFNLRKKIFINRDWSADKRHLFLQEKYVIDKQQILLDIEQNRLHNIKITLERKSEELEQLCQKPDSQEKIQEIATGILRKNYKFVRCLDDVESRLKNLSQRIKHAKKQMDALKVQLSLDNHNTCYKVLSSDNSSSSASIIADAILNDPSAVQLVARSSGKNLEMEKSWELMSEFDKDKLLRKKMLRHL